MQVKKTIAYYEAMESDRWWVKFSFREARFWKDVEYDSNSLLTEPPSIPKNEKETK